MNKEFEEYMYSFLQWIMWYSKVQKIIVSNDTMKYEIELEEREERTVKGAEVE